LSFHSSNASLERIVISDHPHLRLFTKRREECRALSDPNVEIGLTPWNDVCAPADLFQRAPHRRIDRSPLPADNEDIDVAIGIVPALRERPEDERERDPERPEHRLQDRDDPMGPRVELAEWQQQGMLWIDAPQPQVRDSSAAHDPLALQALERAVDGMDRSPDPPNERAGMQLLARNRREKGEQARGGLATRERG